MTQIVNLPALTTITNSLVFPAADTGDGNRTKKVTLGQLVSLSAGPRGPTGQPGIPGPSGPIGPSGPNANQSLNTSSSVLFQSIQINSNTAGITFSDGTIQTTAYRKTTQDLTDISSGDVTLSANQITAPILTVQPPVSGRNLYLPTPSATTAGLILIVKNRSGSNSLAVWGGFGLLSVIDPDTAVQVACDGFTWFVI